MKITLPVYLDYAASTPIDLRVVEKMLPWLTRLDHCGNPSATHAFGRKAAHAIEQARQQVADLVHADTKEIIWTSGATEANNLAIKGIAYHYRNKQPHFITCQTEHEAVIEVYRQLEHEGFSVTYLTPEKNGLVDLEKLHVALQDNTALVSIMHVNNETGVIQNISAIGNLLRERNILFHVDAAQSAGKISIDLTQLSVDLMAFSAHKIYGPKGIGALYINNKKNIPLQAQLHGGGQENNLRSGTLATQQIVGMGEAFALAKQKMFEETKRIAALRDYLWRGLRDLKNVFRNGDDQQCVAGILNVTFADIDNNTLLPALRDLIISSGSACHAATQKPSHVLRALGLSDQLAQNSIRFSLGRFNTEQEVAFTLKKIQDVIAVLRN